MEKICDPLSVSSAFTYPAQCHQQKKKHFDPHILYLQLVLFSPSHQQILHLGTPFCSPVVYKISYLQRKNKWGRGSLPMNLLRAAFPGPVVRSGMRRVLFARRMRRRRCAAIIRSCRIDSRKKVRIGVPTSSNRLPFFYRNFAASRDVFNNSRGSMMPPNQQLALLLVTLHLRCLYIYIHALRRGHG